LFSILTVRAVSVKVMRQSSVVSIQSSAPDKHRFDEV